MRELQALIVEAQEEAEIIKAGEYKITYKVITSSRIDTVALKKEMPDVAEAFTKTSTMCRFCVA